MRFLLLLLVVSNVAFSQSGNPTKNPVKRPKLVVGIVVDQMRWDYLIEKKQR